jgi:hypothetical protein
MDGAGLCGEVFEGWVEASVYFRWWTEWKASPRCVVSCWTPEEDVWLAKRIKILRGYILLPHMERGRKRTLACAGS